jgi:hypothetical protein
MLQCKAFRFNLYQMNTAAQQLGKIGGLSKSKLKSFAVRKNGKLGGRPKNKTVDVVFIYALKLGEEVLYVGSSFDVHKRSVLHESCGKQEIKDAIKIGAQFVTLKKVPFAAADAAETKLIQKLVAQGQCKLNSRMKSGANHQRLNVSCTNIVRHKQTQTIYRSAAAAARAHCVSSGTVANHCKNGGDFELVGKT